MSFLSVGKRVLRSTCALRPATPFSSSTPRVISPSIHKNVLKYSTEKSGRVRLWDDVELSMESADEFTPTPTNGFLPLHEPLTKLPEHFAKMESLLRRMPVTLEDGTPGLLHDGKLGPAVLEELPFYDVKDITNKQLLQALFRDYTFLASAYLLEPCDINYRKSGEYGLARDKLPASIAVPLTIIADKLSCKPFMEYAMSYALYNYKRRNTAKGLDYDNLELVRKLHGGPSEHGFILVHVAMVAHTPELVRNTDRILYAAECKERQEFDYSVRDFYNTMHSINKVMDTMWGRSLPSDYLKLRSFIMGIKDQPMFPNGVMYEGCGEPNPRFYRGESGANDSIIPTCDNLFDLHFPSNPLTDILKDFRSYRPVQHKLFLQKVRDRSLAAGVRTFAMDDVNSAAELFAVIDQVREFRMRHWNFTKEYIIKHSTHPVATGGSPITTWLPNQLKAVLYRMDDIKEVVHSFEKRGQRLTPENKEKFDFINQRYSAQLNYLKREVETLRQKFGASQDVGQDAAVSS